MSATPDHPESQSPSGDFASRPQGPSELRNEPKNELRNEPKGEPRPNCHSAPQRATSNLTAATSCRFRIEPWPARHRNARRMAVAFDQLSRPLRTHAEALTGLAKRQALRRPQSE